MSRNNSINSISPKRHGEGCLGASIYNVRSGWGGRPQWVGGSPKSRQKEQNRLIGDSDKEGRRGQKIPKFCGSPLYYRAFILYIDVK